MKRLKTMRKREGFTLVELLIVIIIIGILAGAMLLVAGSGTDSAEATKVISDLRSLKSATLLYYADHTNETDAPGVDALAKYMDRELATADFATATNSENWWVASVKTKSNGVQGKLADKAEDVGLYNGTATDPTSGDVYTTGNFVWMRAR